PGLVLPLALAPRGEGRARCDRRAAAEGLELRILDQPVGADLDLQLHDVAAGGRADQTGPYRGIVLVHRPDVAGMVVVVEQLVAVAHVSTSSFLGSAGTALLNVPPI